MVAQHTATRARSKSTKSAYKPRIQFVSADAYALPSEGSVRFQTARGRQAAVGLGRPVAGVVRQPGAARTPLPSVPGRGGVVQQERRLR